MLDIKFIRENLEKTKKLLERKNFKDEISSLLDADDRRKELIQEIEQLRSEHKQKSKNHSRFSGEELDRLREQKNKIAKLETNLRAAEEAFKRNLLKFPNLPFDDVPAGKNETENVVLREVGEKENFEFKPKDYLTLAQNLDIIDIERAGKVSGSRFGYLKGEAALLEFALVQLAFSTLLPENFRPIVPPVLIKKEMMQGMGYVDTAEDDEERYFFEKDQMYLVGTSEQAIGPIFADEILKESDLPARFLAFSSCFRREAGSYGKDTKGILRVHQFDKLEMFSFCRSDKSREEHIVFLQMEEKLMKLLKIPYRVMHLCTGDISRPAAETFDIEAWLPGQIDGLGQYREVSSTSNTTDYQARRLNIKYRDKDNKTQFAHMINGTGFAIGRIIISILENYQTKEGFIRIPDALLPWMHGISLIRR